MTEEMASTAQIIDDKDTGEIRNGDDETEVAQYITGFALYFVAAVITMAGFLLLLDSTVLATVIFHSRILKSCIGSLTRVLGYSEYHQPIQFSKGYWLVRQRVSCDNVSFRRKCEGLLDTVLIRYEI